MPSAFDRIRISVPDVVAASGELSALLATEVADSAGRSLFLLGNTALELCETADSAASEARISGLVLYSGEAPARPEAVANNLGLDIVLDRGAALRELRAAAPALISPLRVDHLVLQTRDAPSCIELFRDRLGIRLALDQEKPQWGGRMLFFRCGQMTLEVIANPETGPDQALFWGLAFQCADIEVEAARLRERGVTLSAIREGRKPGTRVATVKSHCLGLPTLLLEPPAAQGQRPT